MLRKVASKVAWVGRTATMMFGLALVLALVFGALSVAVAHTGSAGLFHLDHNNTVTTALTKLTGNLTGQVLKVDNNGTGPALSLEANTNRPPMVVNAAAGTATGLSADELDGIDSSGFASYKRTVVVSPVGTNTQNGTALLNALTAISDASQTKKYLLYVEPGTYDLGSGTLQMKEHVDIEGAGELSTLITGSASDGQETCAKSTVLGANNAELRFLTVRNTGTGALGHCDIAIVNVAASPRLTHVTALATGDQTINIGVLNATSSPTMTDVTATASGSGTNIGVRNFSSNPTIKQSTLSGSFKSLWHESGDAKVALSQLVGPVARDAGTLQCFNNYDGSLASVTCP